MVDQGGTTVTERMQIDGRIVWRSILPTPQEQAGPLMPERARRLGMLCLHRVAAGSRRVPRRHAASMPRPTLRRCDGGRLDSGSAHGPSIACHAVP